ncbi:MAG: adenosylmethionine--8-amino-7-oxononanoate transaminase [Deltaproteobacteria bacterium]|nr:adenosylmethionine--8-amino-7-oxononanoate transaminase [Deltaproteobacteria bacterium]
MSWNYTPAEDLHPFSVPCTWAAEAVAELEAADKSALWKPFTQMAGYVDEQPVIIERGQGNWLRDVRGRAFLDGVSSLWVNVHGHGHPVIQARIRRQLEELDHSTLLGPTNVAAVELAQRLVDLAPGSGQLSRVFYSDSGSTSVEIAVKMAFQFHAQHHQDAARKRDLFVTMTNAYHGDTLGSVSVGGIELFHSLYEPLLFKTRQAPAPDPYHRAFGQDPLEHERRCLEALKTILLEERGRVAGLVMEPLVQGAAGMLCHSPGYLAEAAALCREEGALLIIDEVATGFGRTGTMFACEQAGVVPDLMCLAKGITGGVLPLAATLATETIYEGFLGDHTAYRTFFHGHSYTGNPLACAAALGSLDVFREEGTLARLAPRIDQLSERLSVIERHPNVGDIRRVGVMTGIELVTDCATGEPYPAAQLVGRQVCGAALERGVLIRPLGDVVVLMPPLSITEDELDLLCGTVLGCIDEVCA